MKKSARLLVLEIADEIMKITVPAHEAMCDEEKCTLDSLCPFCQINEILTKAYTTENIDDGS